MFGYCNVGLLLSKSHSLQVPVWQTVAGRIYPYFAGSDPVLGIISGCRGLPDSRPLVHCWACVPPALQSAGGHVLIGGHVCGWRLYVNQG